MSELILCVPGVWKDRTEFLGKIITSEPKGRFMYAGAILADVHDKDHVTLELADADPNLPRAFEVAGQGKIPPDLTRSLQAHTAIAYLHFPIAVSDQRERILKFSTVLERAGGIAVKVESSGVAHTWARWSELLTGTPFDLYCAFVVLVADEKQFYSCGMHHFGLPECAVPRSMPVGAAADIMNRFNFWRVLEGPTLADGHTFSLSADSPHFRMTLGPDTRHPKDALFHNEHGVWSLRGIPTGV